MRVIHVVIGKVNTHKMNGVNKVVHELASAQHSLGHQVSVWGITKNPIHNYPKRSYDTILFKDSRKFSLPKQITAQLATVPQATVFHFHGGFIWQFYMVAKEIVKSGFSYILTPHGSYNRVAMQRSFYKKQLFIWLFENYLVSHAKAIHFIGESEVSGAKSKFQISNYALIPNGENRLELKGLRNRTTSKSLKIGFCGRLDIHTKGLDILLKGIALYIRDNGKPLKLWLIGDGEEKAKLQKLSKSLGLDNYVVFCGSKFGADKVTLFKELDFLVLTSRNEGMPGVVLEASAMGIPSIVSTPTNMAKFVTQHKAGVVVDPNTPVGICKGLAQAFMAWDSELYTKMSAGAINMVESEFDWLKISKKMVLLYER